MANGLSFFDNIKIQLELLLPILNSLRDRYGKNEIDQIVFEVIDRHLKSKYADKAALINGSDRHKWESLNTELLESVGSDVELEIADINDHKIQLYANNCKISEYFKSIDETELGYHLACKVDNHIAETCGEDVKFYRDNTLMADGVRCDYVYKFLE